MNHRSTLPLRRRALAGILGLACVGSGAVAHAADKPATTAEPVADGLVHCLLPGQVRRMGAFATSVTPRRAARLTPAQCQAGGGEYVELQDHSAAVKMWLPMASEGIAEAQNTVGELFDQRGERALAKSWYEKAAAQGDARALVNLAGFLEQSALLAAAKGMGTFDSASRVVDLVSKASGGLVAGLSIQRAERLHVDIVAPLGATPLPRAAGPLVLESPAGPLEVVVRVAGASAVKSVRVNGQEHKTDARGLLSIPVTVTDARTTLLVQAEDEVGAQAQAELTLVQRSAPLAAASGEAPAVTAAPDLLPAASVKPAAPLLPGKRFALVIANQQYQHWVKLDTPRSDAQAVAAVLKQRFGFEVSLLQDATRQQLLAALSRLRQQVGPQDQVVVYYAGHGQMDSITARGYWIPVDGDENDLAQWVSVIDVTDQLSAMTARHVLVIADSCYSGTLTRSLVPAVDQALTLEQRAGPLKQLSKQRARVAMTSGGLEPVVDGGSVEHSLFARSLLDVLGRVNSPMAAQELHNAVSARFAHLARRLKIQQQPQYAPIGFAGHEAGDFVFSPL
jgi:TPR repeat protein